MAHKVDPSLSGVNGPAYNTPTGRAPQQGISNVAGRGHAIATNVIPMSDGNHVQAGQRAGTPVPTTTHVVTNMPAPTMTHTPPSYNPQAYGRGFQGGAHVNPGYRKS